jgi:hypothetical protein
MSAEEKDFALLIRIPARYKQAEVQEIVNGLEDKGILCVAFRDEDVEKPVMVKIKNITKEEFKEIVETAYIKAHNKVL